MAITVSRQGYGQVEPNHLSAQRTGQIYAQLPAKDTITTLENGQFVKYDYAKGEVNYDGSDPWVMVFNEVKLYDGWRKSYKDYAMKKTDFTEGVMTPRVILINVGDIWTTNAIGGAATNGKYEGIELAVGDILTPGAAGFLVKGSDSDNYQIEVVKETTMPDGQPAVKVRRIK